MGPGPTGRGRFTWAAYRALLAFGYLNAMLGPALPYLRAVEQISYLTGALHQLAFALGGGLAGLLASSRPRRATRTTMIRVGLLGAAAAGIGVGYGDRIAITIPAALLMGLLNTAALIPLWASLSDAWGSRRAVAMTEGEVAVSLGGIVVPLLVAGLAATAATWRFAFVVGAGVVVAAVLGTRAVRVPEPAAPPPALIDPAQPARPRGGRRWARPSPTLAIIFAIVALEFGLSFWLASYLIAGVDLDRGLAVALVSVLYAANLLGRLAASRLARRTTPDRLLALALATTLVGLPILIAADGAGLAILGFVIAGAGIGALFPLTSSLHVGHSSRGADSALGQVLLVSAVGQVAGPLVVAIIAQGSDLRIGLFALPAFVLAAAAALAAYERPVAQGA